MTDIIKALDEDLLRKLLCSICKNYLSVSPILINKKGENICGRCKNHAKSEAYICNAFYEILARGFYFPCKYALESCSVKQVFNDIHIHEKKCPFRTCDCKVKSCKWSGSVVELIIHYNATHGRLILKSDTPKQIVEGQETFLLIVHGYHFLLKWNCSNANLQIQIGPLDIHIPDADITFICRLFSTNPHKPSLAIETVGLNASVILPLSNLYGDVLSSMLFSIHTLVPDEIVLKKIENLKKLECHKCNRQMAIPILACSQGHVSCADCAGPDATFCSDCQDNVIFNRVPELEIIAVSSLYTCKCDGCSLQFSYKSIRAHEQSCFKRKYTCLYCLQWQGLHDEIVKHDRFCRSKFIFCPMSLNTQVTVLGIRTGELHYSLLAFRELFVVSFLLKNNSAEVTVVNFGPASLLNWYRFEADMVHVIDFDFSWNQTYPIARTVSNRYELLIPGEQIQNFGGKEFYKLTVRILKSDFYLK